MKINYILTCAKCGKETTRCLKDSNQPEPHSAPMSGSCPAGGTHRPMWVPHARPDLR